MEHPKAHTHSIVDKNGTRVFHSAGILRITKRHHFGTDDITARKEAAISMARKWIFVNRMLADSFEALPIALAEVDVVARFNGDIVAIFYYEDAEEA